MSMAEVLKRKLSGQILHRRLHQSELKLINSEKRSASFIIVSRDNGTPRYDWWDDKNFIEVLDVEGADWSRLNSVYYNHNTEALPIGRTEGVRREEGQIKSDVIFDDDEFSDRVFKKVVSGSLRGCSIGYVPRDILYEERRDGPDVVTIKTFDIVELSILGVQADPGAVLGRKFDQESVIVSDKGKREVSMAEVEEVLDQKVSEQRRILDLIEMGKRFQKETWAEEFIRIGKTADDLGRRILDDFEQKLASNKLIEGHSADIGMSKREVNRYSLLRAIQAALNNDWSKAGLEREASQAVTVELGKSPKGFYVPNEILSQRFLNTKVGQEGGYLVPSERLELEGKTFIDVLRENEILENMGAHVLTGLKGKLTIPRLMGSSLVYWIEEGRPVRSSQFPVDQMALDLKTVAGCVPYTRSMLMQSSPDIEKIVKEDLAKNLALEIDRVGLTGRGVEGEPRGILYTPFVNQVSGENLNWEKVVEMETVVATQNAKFETMAYLASPTVQGLVKTRPKQPGFPQYLASDDGRLNGHRLGVSNQVPRKHLFYGDFSQIFIGLFGTLDVLVDPYKESETGSVYVFSFQSADVGVRYPQAFSVSTDVT